MSPLITIAIPTYKRLQYLKEAVASALGQSYSNIEVVISQDPSQDGLDETIHIWSQTIASQNSKVRYRYNSQNLGLAGNWNAVADAARGEYIVIIGDDDRLLPNFVEKLVNVIQPDTLVAFANHYLINSQGQRLEAESYQHTKHYQRDRLAPGEISDPERLVWQNTIPMSAALVRTQAVQQLRFKEDLNTPEIELFVRLVHQQGRFIFVPDYLSEYRVHQQAATALGLRIDRLVAYLLASPVRPEVEPYKRELLSQLMVNAVSRSLLEKKIHQAKEFIQNEYYPDSQRKSLKGLVQKFCTLLPTALGCRLYRLVHTLYNYRIA